MNRRTLARVVLAVSGAVVAFETLRGAAWMLLLVEIPSPLWLAFEAFGSLATGREVVWVLYLLALLSLLLWSLIEVQRTERGRTLVSLWSIALCLCTAPFLVGLVLCSPVFFLVLLPMARKYRAARPNRDV